MTELTDTIRGFLVDQVERLEPHGYVSVGVPSSPFLVLEIGQTATGALEARVPPRHPATPLSPAVRAKLAEAGFNSEDPASPRVPWSMAATDPGHAVEIVRATLGDVFDVTVGDSVNLVHGSHLAEHEASQRLDELRARIEPVLADMLGHRPEQDADGDYQYPIDHTTVLVAPRVIPGAVAVVRIIAITNGGVTVGPELGLFLARLNFGLMFGRFALDAEHRSIWFDETLLGEDISDDQLRFTVKLVAETAAEWAPRLQQMFGGITHKDIEEAQRRATPKPGTGGYL